jgi:hypothetical protein
MDTPVPEHVVIQGITAEGKTFRPSDWSERLAGVMSEFHPSRQGAGRRLGYSPWCVPSTREGVTCVVVSRKLRDYQPMAWDFVMNFARDNGLRVFDEADPS